MSMGGGGGTTSQVTTQELSPEQRALIKPVIPIAEDILKPGAVQPYPGSGISPQTEAEAAAQRMMLGSAGQMQDFTSKIPALLQGIMSKQAGTIDKTGQLAQQGGDDLMSMLNTMMGVTGGQIGAGQAQNQGALNTLLNPDILSATTNPHLQSYMDAAVRPLNQQFSNVIMPGIAGEAITAGGYGGSRQGISEGLASQGLQQQTGDVTARMASEGYGQGLNAMLGGLGQSNAQQGNILSSLGQMFGTGVTGINANTQNQIGAGQLQGQTLAQMMQGLSASPDILSSMGKPAEMVSAVGAQQRAEEQAMLSEQVQKFINSQMLPFTLAQDVAAMAFGMPGGTTRSTTTGGQGGPGALQMVSGVASALPALLGLFGLSDRRLKENITPKSVLSDGLIVYHFNFKDDPDKYEVIGLMADEVQELYPEAVRSREDGFFEVNYSLVPTWQNHGIRS